MDYSTLDDKPISHLSEDKINRRKLVEDLSKTIIGSSNELTIGIC